MTQTLYAHMNKKKMKGFPLPELTSSNSGKLNENRKGWPHFKFSNDTEGQQISS
jgi:hypothetical protein